MTIEIAGAPVSFGVFERTDPDRLGALPGPDDVVGALAEAGYRGIDLGPVGFLGRGARLRDRLRHAGLRLVGGWIELPFSDEDRLRSAWPALDEALAVFAEAGDDGRLPTPKPTLADAGDPVRQATPGGAPELTLRGPAWDRFAGAVQEAADRVRRAGLEPTFHHHMGTYVERPEEVDALLDATDVGLTFDTGHLLLGGGDVQDGWRRWSSRINHVHLKDVDLEVLAAVRARHGDMLDVWRSRAFVPLGEGDLPVDDIVRRIVDDGFDGWIVIEQDVLPTTDVALSDLVRDQIVNLERLERVLGRRTVPTGERTP